MSVTVSFFNNFIEDIGKKRMDLSADTYKIVLVNGYTFNAAHHSKSQTSGELSTANGYTAGGGTLANITWGWDEGLTATKWDADDFTWDVDVTGDIGPATGAFIYNDTITSPTADRLVCYIDFGGEESAGAGTQFKIVFNADGILTIG